MFIVFQKNYCFCMNYPMLFILLIRLNPDFTLSHIIAHYRTLSRTAMIKRNSDNYSIVWTVEHFLFSIHYYVSIIIIRRLSVCVSITETRNAIFKWRATLWILLRVDDYFFINIRILSICVREKIHATDTQSSKCDIPLLTLSWRANSIGIFTG